MAVPEPVNSRVYIGGLGEQAVVQDLEGLLKDYQPYRDLTLLRGFGFVQFHDEQSAQNAIKGLNGKVFSGRKLTVKVANDNRAKKGLLPRGHPLQGAALPGPLRDRSPINMPASGRSEDNALHLLDVAPYATQSFGPPDLSGAYAEAGIPARPLHRAPGLPPESNDCEIIVVNKELTAYAESIEARLKRAGMTVDLLFPNNDVPIGKVLTNIASRGSFYAILITPENQERNSITVNVLYGIPAEHRNMPKDDAVMFIINHFTAKNRQERAPMAFPPMNSFHEITPAAPVPPVPVTMTDQPLSHEKHPEAIQNMINLLAANRSLTVLQYERLIKYLSERKEAQIRIELGEDPEDTTNSLISSSAPAAPAAKTKGATEKELEKKILDILNKPSIVGVAKAANPVEFLERKGASATPLPTCHLLYDPKVQRALDSLLQGQLFMKFTG
ncbi:nuclear receptor coactivator 5 [Anopheles aquasalis]|uniref:nuclear receptor coactivator 5 n=1 Tax=Anopheles aquasalis TaxID=42839 RepID=UPI00215AF050|nr:nuclear receptor coactivator 5 [Anopheles aquasalis]